MTRAATAKAGRGREALSTRRSWSTVTVRSLGLAGENPSALLVRLPVHTSPPFLFLLFAGLRLMETLCAWQPIAIRDRVCLAVLASQAIDLSRPRVQ
jgi:hypothetical protein